MNKLDYIVSFMDEELQAVFEAFDNIVTDKISEIRIRRAKPLVIVIRNTSYFVDYNGDLYDYICSNAVCIASKAFDEMFYKLCDYSIYSSIDAIKKGYITLENGARVGIAGTAVYNDGNMQTVKDIISLNIRIPRQLVGCSQNVLNFLYVNAFPSIIVAGPPNSGKTTLLRDLAKQLSDGFNNHYRKIAVIDERNELAGKCGDSFTMDLGVNTDVLTGFSKAVGIELATRTLSPEMIICDEISNSEELEKIKYGFCAGVSFALSVHISNKSDLARKPIVRGLIEADEFEYIVLLEGHSYSVEIIEVSEIYDEIHRNDNIDNVLNRLGATIIK